MLLFLKNLKKEIKMFVTNKNCVEATITIIKN